MQTTVRTIYSLEVLEQPQPSPERLLTIRVRGDGFLYNMVRITVGTLIEVSEGKIAPSDIEKIIESKDRALAGRTAVADGLYLHRVFIK